MVQHGSQENLEHTDEDIDHGTREGRQRAWKQRIQECIDNGITLQPPD